MRRDSRRLRGPTRELVTEVNKVSDMAINGRNLIKMLNKVHFITEFKDLKLRHFIISDIKKQISIINKLN